MATLYPPAAAAASPCSRVELSISCSDLLDTDIFSKSDPIAVVYTRQNRQQAYAEVTRARARARAGARAGAKPRRG